MAGRSSNAGLKHLQTIQSDGQQDVRPVRRGQGRADGLETGVQQRRMQPVSSRVVQQVVVQRHIGQRFERAGGQVPDRLELGTVSQSPPPTFRVERSDVQVVRGGLPDLFHVAGRRHRRFRLADQLARRVLSPDLVVGVLLLEVAEQMESQRPVAFFGHDDLHVPCLGRRQDHRLLNEQILDRDRFVLEILNARRQSQLGQRRSRHDHRVPHAMVAQIAGRFGAQDGLKNGLFARHVQAASDERMNRPLARFVSRAGLSPLPHPDGEIIPARLMLERIGGQHDLAPAAQGVELLPIHIGTHSEQGAQRCLQGLFVVLPGAETGQPGLSGRGQTDAAQRAEDRLRPDFQKGVWIKSGERRHAVGEAYRLADVAAPITGLGDFRTGDLARNVGNHGKPRRRQGDAADDLLEFGQHRVHQRRMESVRYGQPFRLDAFGRQPLDDFVHRRPGTRNHGLLRRVDRGDRDLVLQSGQRASDARLVGRHGNHLSARRQGLHQPRAGGDQLQAVLQTEHAGQTARHVLADAVPRSHARLNAPRLPELGQRVFERKQRGLSVRGFVQRRRLTRGRIEHRQQRLGQQRAQQLIAAVQRLAEQWLAVVQLASHADQLRTLPSEQKGDFRGSFLAALAQHRFNLTAGGQRLQTAPQFLAGAAGHRRAIIEMGSPRRSREADLVQLAVRLAGQELVERASHLGQALLRLGGQHQQVR